MALATPLAPYVKLRDLGIPVIKKDNIMTSAGGKIPGHVVDIAKLLAQTFISTLVFLIIIVWFTLALNAATRTQTDEDYYLFQFSVYFSIIAIFIIMFTVLLII